MTTDERRFLIAIGSPECPKMGLRPLPRVAADIERMAAFFTSAEQSYRRVLANEIPLGSEAERIKDELEKWFSHEDRTENDCVVIYYAGHGDQAGKFNQHYLFTSDSDPRRIAGTAIETAGLPKILFAGEGLRPQSLLLILDTCYAGQGAGQAAAALAGVKGSAFSGIGAGMFILASAGPNDTAGDGAFVDAFFQAMSDKSVFGAGGAGYLDPLEISALVTECFRQMNRGQQSEADVVGGGKIRQTFIRNVDYSPLLAGSTLEDLHHWDMKARGVEVFTLAGDYFVGREAALDELRKWLASPASDLRARLVTGRPGSGKSAVLGRLVMELQRRTTNGVRTTASIHAHRLNLGQVAASLGRQLGKKEQDVDSMLTSLSEPGPTVRVLIDALDEAQESQSIRDRLLIPLAALPRVRLIVGTRRDRSGRTPLGADAFEIDLDSPSYFRQSDIESYLLRRLTDLRPDLVATSERLKLETLARVIAQRSDQSFLYARVVSRWIATSNVKVDTSAPDWIRLLDIPGDVLEAFGRDLDRFDAQSKRRVIDLLLPLAYAQGKGLPQKTMWQQLATAIAGRPYTNADIRELKELAGYYITRDAEDDETVYRLFHEAFAEYLRDLSKDEDVPRRIYNSLRSGLPRDSSGHVDWRQAHEPYVLKYLPVHAMQAARLGELLNDAEFLLHTAPQGITSVLRAMPPDPSGCATAYLRAYSHMLSGDVLGRAQYLALSAAQYNCGVLLNRLRSRESQCDWFPVKAWYRDTGSHVIADIPEFKSACFTWAPDDVLKLVVIASDKVRLLNLSTGDDLASFAFSGGDISSAITIPSTDEILIAIAHDNYGVSVLDVSQRKPVWRRSLASKEHGVASICALESTAGPILVAGGEDGSFTVWSVLEGKELRRVQAHKSGITFVGSGVWQGRKVLISCSDFYIDRKTSELEQIRLWDADSFELMRSIKGPKASIAYWSALVEVSGKPYLATYFNPNAQYCIYDPDTGKSLVVLDNITSQPFGWWQDGESAVIAGGFSNQFHCVRISTDHRSSLVVKATAGVFVEGGKWLGPVQAGLRSVVVSVGNNVRVWDLAHLTQQASQAAVTQVGLIHEDGEPLFSLSAPSHSSYFAGMSRYGNLRVWNGDGECVLLKQVVTSLDDPSAQDFDFVQLTEFAGEYLYVTAGRSGAVDVWDLRGRPVRPKLKTGGLITAFHVSIAAHQLLAIIALRKDGHYEVGAWDLMRGEEVTTEGRFEIHHLNDKSIDYVAAVEYNESTILIAAQGHSHYRRVAGWDLHSLPLNSTLRAERDEPDQKVLWERRAPRTIKCMAPVHDGLLPAIGIGDENGAITILDPSDGQVAGSYRAHDKQVTAVTSMGVGERQLVVSAGWEGTIIGTDLSEQESELWPESDEDSEASPKLAAAAFKIEIGDRIKTIAALAGGRIAAGTEQGFLLFRINQ